MKLNLIQNSHQKLYTKGVEAGIGLESQRRGLINLCVNSKYQISNFEYRFLPFELLLLKVVICN